MKSTLLRLLGALLCLALLLGAGTVSAFATEGDVVIDANNFPDAFFRKDIAAAFDKNGDGILSAEEAATVTYLDYGIGNLNTEFTPGGTRKDKGAYTITDLTGVEHFPNLEKLYVNGYDELCALTKLDVSQNTKLKDLFCASNQLTELNLNGLSALQELDCEDNLLAFLDLSDCAALERLVCDTNSLTELDLSSNPLLSFVYCYSTDISVLNLSKHTKLTNVSCANTAITTLDLSNSPELLSLDICGTRIQSLNLSNNTKLQTLWCSGSALSALDLRQNAALEHIDFRNSHFTSLDFSATAVTTTMQWACHTTTDVNILAGNACPITLSAEHTFDLSTLPGAFDVSKASEWKGGSVSGSLLTVDEGAESVSYTYDVGNDLSAEFTLTVAGINPPDQPEQPEQYEITEGKNGSWTQESDGTLTVRASGPLDKFTGLQVDGKPVAPENYTALSGSTVITLKKEFLKTLSAGTHKLTICFEDGACSTNLRIKPLGSPKTGESELRIWCSMLLTFCALMCCVALIAKKRCCSR